MTLSHHSNRTLDLLVSELARCAVSVQLSDRLEAMGSVVLSQRRILLRASRAGIYDLFFCAELIRQRGQLRVWRELDVPSEVAEDYLRHCEESLLARFPRLEALSGALKGATSDTLEVSWKRATVKPLRADQIDPSGRGTIAPGLGVDGAEGDFAALVEAIASGRIPTQRLDGLPELPFVVCPTELGISALAPDDWEATERDLEGVEESARDAARCMREKAEGKVSHAEQFERYFAGDEVDPALLHDAAIAARRGVELPIYRSNRQVWDYLHEPSEHLSALFFDLSCLAPGPIGFGGVSPELLLMIARAVELLEGDALVMAFHDRLVELPNGEQVYLHQPLRLKEPRQPFDRAFYGRLRAAIKLGGGGEGFGESGEGACWHPVQFRTVAQELREAAEDGDYLHIEPYYVAYRGLEAPYDHPGFVRRCAEDIDRRLEELTREFQAQWHELYVVSEELVDNAPPEGPTSKMLNPRWSRS